MTGRPEASPNAITVTAVHEAGHAVVAVWLGVPLVSVDVVPSTVDGTIGHTVCAALPSEVHRWHIAGHPRPVPPKVLERLERELMVHLAGEMAQARSSHPADMGAVRVDESRFGSIVVGWDWHMGDVLDAISDGAADRRARTRRLAGVTQGLLKREAVWASVEAVADELAARRRVTGRRVREIASEVAGRSARG